MNTPVDLSTVTGLTVQQANPAFLNQTDKTCLVGFIAEIVAAAVAAPDSLVEVKTSYTVKRLGRREREYKVKTVNVYFQRILLRQQQWLISRSDASSDASSVASSDASSVAIQPLFDVGYRGKSLHGQYKQWPVDNSGDNNYVGYIHCHYSDGRLHGDYTAWYIDGSLHLVTHYQHGVKHGKFTSYFIRSCDIYKQCWYHHGKPRRYYIEFQWDDILRIFIAYDEDGKGIFNLYTDHRGKCLTIKTIQIHQIKMIFELNSSPVLSELDG